MSYEMIASHLIGTGLLIWLGFRVMKLEKRVKEDAEDQSKINGDLLDLTDNLRKRIKDLEK